MLRIKNIFISLKNGYGIFFILWKKYHEKVYLKLHLTQSTKQERSDDNFIDKFRDFSFEKKSIPF